MKEIFNIAQKKKKSKYRNVAPLTLYIMFRQ